MFGDLFEEDGDGFSSSTPGTGVKGRECEPPPPRGKVKLCGIKNQGGTCYLNSLIQTLLFTPEFREELFRLGPDELGCLADKDKPEAKARVIPLELQRLFSHLLLVDEQTASTTDLTDSFGWTNNEEMGQQDVQELNRILFSALESSLVGTSGSSLIHRLYHGTLVNQITCKECGNISERQEDFLDLTVSVRGVSGLEEALWNMFVEEEMFEGNNLYRCSRCYQLVRAAKSAKLRKLPPFLTISLLRFNFDFAKCERYKETGRYVFPLTFNLRPFCEQNNWPDSESSYELFSVIIHKGGCYGGHYHVYIKDIDQLGHWEAPEEEVKVKAKTQRQEDKVGEKKKESENSVDTEDPLSVLTVILAQEESKCVLVDQLGQKLMNKTGMPWSKKYKKQYGTISKANNVSNDQISLYSAGVSNGSDLFVWNGRKVSGVAVKTGMEWEPVLLTVLRPSVEELGCGDGSGVEDTDGSGLVCSMKGFAGGATLGTVLEALGPQEAFLCQEQSRPGANGGGASGWRVFPPRDMLRTLRELSLKDGDALLLLQPEELDSSIFSLSGDMVTVTTPSDCRWLQVEFCPQSGMKEEEEEEEQGKKRSKVSASGNMLLAEVKEKALEELRLQDELSGVECCLRQMDRTGKHLPPVHEHLSVRDAGIRLMTSLYLCPGPVPTATQLFLYFIVGVVPSVGQELEIIVEESLTVKECLTEMLQMAKLDGESWHLRRVDWCEEIGEPLMDENASLKEAKVNHGDTLVLVEGRLPPKGYLKLSVKMYIDAIDSSSVPELNHTEESLSIEGLITEGSGSEMRFIGHVEISEEASLDDLKTQMMTLPALQDVCVPSPAFLRVWLLEDKKLSRILRGNQQTLRKLKLGNGAEVCVQRLMNEEDLGLKDLLLRVQMGVPGEKAYYPSEEFLWDAGRDGTPRGLYATLASRYGLTPDNLLLAKHLPDKHTWMPICNWTQQVSKRKKKRKAESLQAAPFYLKDGDIIGVKNLLVDNNKEFTILEDEIGQQRLREEAANHNTRCILLFCFYCHSPILQDIGLSPASCQRELEKWSLTRAVYQKQECFLTMVRDICEAQGRPGSPM
ncbi:ubiquitin carboxyl-terminal hydrolase 40 [Sinocyclocheilus grahami]|uniref:ubiquitin carboxyl-terminal hydrolase 40 n=1 Tax=Sinocyclocheilus grahami TaxID=75366 RepID=UPI0007AC9E7C|nr:PREDICTED: ubiquitin carboxyl-terminal hydrolase 40-like [Sinocyclocheilus grahami]